MLLKQAGVRSLDRERIHNEERVPSVGCYRPSQNQKGPGDENCRGLSYLREPTRYFALVSSWKMPKQLPSVSRKYAAQPTPGIAIFSTTWVPPAFFTSVID